MESRSTAKYLFVINSMGAGGAERSLLDFLPAVDEAGIVPIVVTLRDSAGFENELAESLFDHRSLASLGRFAQIVALRRMIISEQPDLVYTSLFEADIAGRIALLGIDIPLVSSIVNASYASVRSNDPRVRGHRLALARALDSATGRALTTRFHAVSESAKESAVSTLKLDPELITVIHRGRDRRVLGNPSPQRRQMVRERLGKAPDSELVINVGRQEYQKGQVHLVRAFARVLRERPKAELLIAGRPGNASPDLQEAVTSEGLQSKVSLLGHRSDVPDLLTAADLFVFPSLFEGLGGAVIEAMALGLPIIASDIPAMREIASRDKNALLVPPEDPDALAAAIVELLEDSERRAGFGYRSRQIFEENFVLESANQRLLEFLGEVAVAGR